MGMDNMSLQPSTNGVEAPTGDVGTTTQSIIGGFPV